MPLPAETDSLDAVPEAARAFYVETDDGRYRLDADGVEDVSGLKSALEKERAARRELKAELDRLGSEQRAGQEGEASLTQVKLEAALIAAEARAAIHAEHGIAELLLPVIVPRLILAESEAGISVTIRGEGDAPAENPEDGTPLTPRDLVRELQASPVYGRAFELPARGGSGAPSLGQAGGNENVIAMSDQNALDRNIAAIASGRVRVSR
ncbi:hypothetical protein [Nisaea denitrificans]|uniref:hypothetical protein n=1 Tax=Nisaea denitrificans TaxID=390877 RepID=UPI00041651DD|nr:hypothetical protein [Nisaea denitrificans]